MSCSLHCFFDRQAVSTLVTSLTFWLDRPVNGRSIQPHYNKAISSVKTVKRDGSMGTGYTNSISCTVAKLNWFFFISKLAFLLIGAHTPTHPVGGLQNTLQSYSVPHSGKHLEISSIAPTMINRYQSLPTQLAHTWPRADPHAHIFFFHGGEIRKGSIGGKKRTSKRRAGRTGREY